MIEEIIHELLGKYKNDMTLLDGFLQLALNPTSAKAGYNIKENYLFIERYLKLIYEFSTKEVNNVIEKLRKKFNELLNLDDQKYYVYKLRDLISDEILAAI